MKDDDEDEEDMGAELSGSMEDGSGENRTQDQLSSIKDGSQSVSDKEDEVMSATRSVGSMNHSLTQKSASEKLQKSDKSSRKSTKDPVEQVKKASDYQDQENSNKTSHLHVAEEK